MPLTLFRCVQAVKRGTPLPGLLLYAFLGGIRHR